MSRRYTSEEKMTILDQLRANYGDVALTHHQTGVPERTLREWRRDLLLPLPPKIPARRQESSLDFSPVTDSGGNRDISEFENDLEVMKFVRSRIMQELLNLSTSLGDDSGVASPYHRVLILSRLLERLKKLDDHLQPYTPAERTVRKSMYENRM